MWLKIPKISRAIDWWLVGAILFLIGLSLVMHYSIGVNQEITGLDQFYKQLTMVLVGGVIFVLMTAVDVRYFKVFPIIYLAIAVLLLLAVLFWGSTIKGTTGWFVIGSFSLQPVEFVKALLILFMASYLGNNIYKILQPRHVIFSGGAAMLVIVLVTLQPDLGSAFILFMLWFGLVILLRAPKRMIALIIALIAVASIIGWTSILQDYQKERLTTFMRVTDDPLGSGYNVAQSIIAVGSGGFWGRGIGLGTQSQLHFVPEIAADFIFAVVAEELGFIGALATITAFVIIFLRLCWYVQRVNDHFSLVICAGALIYLATQTILTIGMNIGLVPVTGLPLPLISAGGSSMISTLFLLGICHNAYILHKS